MSDAGSGKIAVNVLEEAGDSGEEGPSHNGTGVVKNKKIKWFVSLLKEKGFFTEKNQVPHKEKITIDKKKLQILNVENLPPTLIHDDFDPEIEQQAIDSIEPKDLQVLSTHLSSRIRAAVGFNPMTTCPVLQKLAIDESDEVRFAVVRNTSTPEKIIQILLNDQNEKIRIRALARSNTTSIDVLQKLSIDQDVDIRRKVAFNTATPLDILVNLAKDPDKAVSSAAQYKIKKLRKKTGKLG